MTFLGHGFWQRNICVIGQSHSSSDAGVSTTATSQVCVGAGHPLTQTQHRCHQRPGSGASSASSLLMTALETSEILNKGCLGVESPK